MQLHVQNSSSSNNCLPCTYRTTHGSQQMHNHVTDVESNDMECECASKYHFRSWKGDRTAALHCRVVWQCAASAQNTNTHHHGEMCTPALPGGGTLLALKHYALVCRLVLERGRAAVLCGTHTAPSKLARRCAPAVTPCVPPFLQNMKFEVWPPHVRRVVCVCTNLHARRATRIHARTQACNSLLIDQ